jgi:hypothetical protein
MPDRSRNIAARLCLLAILAPPFLGRLEAADDVGSWIASLHDVGPEGKGSIAAAAAWRKLSKSGAQGLLLMLASLDNAQPLAANWIRTAIDANCDRLLAEGSLPLNQLRRFLSNRNHSPRGRHLAFEWIVRATPNVKDQLISSMLDDPSFELRHEAVAQQITKGDRMLAGKKLEEAIAAYWTAFEAARDLNQVKLLVKKMDELNVDVDVTRHLGFVTRWKVIGPFDNTGEHGFHVSYQPETMVDYSATLQGKDGPVLWIDHTTEDDYGWVDLNKLLGKKKGVCAYAAADFLCESEREVELRMGSYNAVKLWVNGSLLCQQNIYHSGAFLDQYVAATVLKRGRNRILVKVCQNEQTEKWAEFWEFQLRVCDAIGGGILSKSSD